MAWDDLGRGILEEFATRAAAWWAGDAYTRLECDRYQAELVRKREYMRATAPARNAARQAARVERAAVRPPCPHCGAPVERVGSSATLPKYCAPKCARAAAYAKWWAKNRDARNERRRAA